MATHLARLTAAVASAAIVAGAVAAAGERGPSTVELRPATETEEVAPVPTPPTTAAQPSVEEVNREVRESARRPTPTTAPAPARPAPTVATPVELPRPSTTVATPPKARDVPVVPGAAPRPAGELPPGYVMTPDGPVKVPMGYGIGPDGKVYPATTVP